jgi:4a-hydroxytetrahydrobiopterin dehydratase
MELREMSNKIEAAKCEPCENATAALKGDALKPLAAGLGEGWRIVDETRLEKEYSFKDFREALAFTNRVGEIAEQEGHHPDVLLSWGKVGLHFTTHSIGGLTKNDFVMAAKADAAL